MTGNDLKTLAGITFLFAGAFAGMFIMYKSSKRISGELKSGEDEGWNEQDKKDMLVASLVLGGAVLYAIKDKIIKK